jgi:hypothetical protein
MQTASRLRIAAIGWLSVAAAPTSAQLTPGPDLITGDVFNLTQLGREGSRVGLAMGVAVCNRGNTRVHFVALPAVDHPALVENLYRLKDDRFEQVGQSWALHDYAPL